MHICLITEYFAPEIGAAPVRLRAFADALTRQGHTVEVVCALPNYPTGRFYPGYERRFRETEDLGPLTIRRVWVYPAIGSGAKRYANYLTFAATSLVFLRGRQRTDVVVVESPPLSQGPVALLYGRLRRAPVVLNVSDLWPDSVVRLGLADESSRVVKAAYALERWLYRRCDRITYVTEGIGRSLRDEKGVDPARLLFLPNGVDTELFAPTPADTALARSHGLEGKKVFLYAGTHSVAAGMEMLADAAERLADDDTIRLVTVGDGPAKAPLQQLVRERRLTNLVMLDAVPPATVAQLYSFSTGALSTLRANDLFAGTRPAKMFPPMSCGKPLVYAGEGEGARLVEEHRTGLVTPPEDVDAFVAAIRRLAASPDLAAELGANGRRWVTSELSWDTLTQQWLEQLAASGIGP